MLEPVSDSYSAVNGMSAMPTILLSCIVCNSCLWSRRLVKLVNKFVMPIAKSIRVSNPILRIVTVD